MAAKFREGIALTHKCSIGRTLEQRGPGETVPIHGVTVQTGHLESRGRDFLRSHSKTAAESLSGRVPVLTFNKARTLQDGESHFTERRKP